MKPLWQKKLQGVGGGTSSILLSDEHRDRSYDLYADEAGQPA